MGRKWMAKACLVLLLIQTLNTSAGAVGTSARSAILVDADSGRVLYEQNADERMLIASITKIMTAVVALENGKTTDTYTVTGEDMAEGSLHVSCGGGDPDAGGAALWTDALLRKRRGPWRWPTVSPVRWRISWRR